MYEILLFSLSSIFCGEYEDCGVMTVSFLIYVPDFCLLAFVWSCTCKK